MEEVKKKKSLRPEERWIFCFYYNTPPGGNIYIIIFEFIRGNALFDVVG